MLFLDSNTSIGRPATPALAWASADDLLAELPELTVILTDFGCWGADRYFRPLVERYPNVYVEIAERLLAEAGVEL